MLIHKLTDTEIIKAMIEIGYCNIAEQDKFYDTICRTIAELLGWRSISLTLVKNEQTVLHDVRQCSWFYTEKNGHKSRNATFRIAKTNTLYPVTNTSIPGYMTLNDESIFVRGENNRIEFFLKEFTPANLPQFDFQNLQMWNDKISFFLPISDVFTSQFRAIVASGCPLNQLDHLKNNLKNRWYTNPAIQIIGNRLYDLAKHKAHPQFTQVPDTLTDREVQFLNFFAQGYKNSKIAESLNISTGTIKSMKHRIKTKLDLKTDVDLFKALAKFGIITV